MSTTARAASEAAAWAFVGVLLAIGSFFFFGRLSVPIGCFAVIAAALAIVGSVTGCGAVAALVRLRVPGRRLVLGVRRGAAVAVLVAVVVASVSATFTFGPLGSLDSLFAQLGYTVLFAGGPFAVLGAVLGCWVERQLFGFYGA